MNQSTFKAGFSHYLQMRAAAAGAYPIEEVTSWLSWIHSDTVMSRINIDITRTSSKMVQIVRFECMETHCRGAVLKLKGSKWETLGQ